MLNRLRLLLESIALFTSLTLLGSICLVWTAFALPLLLVLPDRAGTACGRWGILVGFRFYVWTLQFSGAYRMDLSALNALRHEKSIILAPNHPSLIDALLIIAHNRHVACVMKSALMNNVFLGAGARLARYIRNEPTRRMISEGVAELARGGIVLLFPEGTRTRIRPVNALTASVGIIARRARAPVQTLLIEQNSGFLGKGWSLFKRPSLPIRYSMRLGKRFDPPTDVREFTAELERYFRSELPGRKS